MKPQRPDPDCRLRAFAEACADLRLHGHFQEEDAATDSTKPGNQAAPEYDSPPVQRPRPSDHRLPPFNRSQKPIQSP